MNDPVVVLDSGVLDRASTDHRFRATLRHLVEGGWSPIIPTVVLAGAVTGGARDAPVNQLLRRLGTVTTDDSTARRAGHLRHVAGRSGARRPPSGIDAIVAAHAADEGAGVVFTTDPGDLRRLLDGHPRIRVEKP